MGDTDHEPRGDMYDLESVGNTDRECLSEKDTTSGLEVVPADVQRL